MYDILTNDAMNELREKLKEHRAVWFDDSSFEVDRVVVTKMIHDCIFYFTCEPSYYYKPFCVEEIIDIVFGSGEKADNKQ